MKITFIFLSDLNKVKSDSRNVVYLSRTPWDDWFEFSTVHTVNFYDSEGVYHHLGTIKIGQFNMIAKQRSPDVPERFEELPQNQFSIGQDVDYYLMLNNLGDEIRDAILKGLHDIALDSELCSRAIKERVTRISLLRSVTASSVEGQFRRLAQGDASLSEYNFTFRGVAHPRSTVPPISLDFHVFPNSNPPSNIHVIIGRNGVGKTHLLNSMIYSLVNEEWQAAKHGVFDGSAGQGSLLFANLVSVTFSAFDESEPIEEKKDKSKGIRYSYIGLKRAQKKGEPALPPKSPVILKNEFVKSVEACRTGSKNARWLRALQKLEADPIFKETDISQIARGDSTADFSDLAGSLFNKLSSGHKIVLLTITRLVETVEEKSLVLLDEPEGHLHPPLLSAFIRALSDLLITRNAVAIIATHSPVVLQEVPRTCIWKLRRTGNNAIVERLETESFGENVGSLTQEVFGLEVTDSGFHKLLTDAVATFENYDLVINHFNNELGGEAKAIVRGLFITKNQP